MKIELRIFLIAYIILLLVIFVLPFFSVENYSILGNTTSQLGAQNSPNAWVMNITFGMMGVTSVLAGWRHYKGFMLHRILLLFFGVSMILVAFFHHAPINETLDFNVREDDLHSLFASSTGLSFTILAIATGFIKKNRSEMMLPIGIGIAASLLSMLEFNYEELMGLWQRMIFILSFGWMIYEFGN